MGGAGSRRILSYRLANTETKSGLDWETMFVMAFLESDNTLDKNMAKGVFQITKGAKTDIERIANATGYKGRLTGEWRNDPE